MQAEIVVHFIHYRTWEKDGRSRSLQRVQYQLGGSGEVMESKNWDDAQRVIALGPQKMKMVLEVNRNGEAVLAIDFDSLPAAR